MLWIAAHNNASELLRLFFAIHMSNAAILAEERRVAEEQEAKGVACPIVFTQHTEQRNNLSPNTAMASLSYSEIRQNCRNPEFPPIFRRIFILHLQDVDMPRKREREKSEFTEYP